MFFVQLECFRDVIYLYSFIVESLAVFSNIKTARKVYDTSSKPKRSRLNYKVACRCGRRDRASICFFLMGYNVQEFLTWPQEAMLWHLEQCWDCPDCPNSPHAHSPFLTRCVSLSNFHISSPTLSPSHAVLWHWQSICNGIYLSEYWNDWITVQVFLGGASLYMLGDFAKWFQIYLM